MVGVMIKFQSLSVVVDKPSVAIQIIVGVPTDSVLLCQRFGAEVAVSLGLVQCHNALLAAHKSRTVLTQFVFDFSLRQDKSGGRFFALRLVDLFDLLGFGRDVAIEET